jgi:hypothetical protein
MIICLRAMGYLFVPFLFQVQPCPTFNAKLKAIEFSEMKRIQVIKDKIDSIKAVLIKDTSTTLVFCCNEGFMSLKGYGCVIYKNYNSLTGKKIYIHDGVCDELEINRKVLKKNAGMFNLLFRDPGSFLNDFPPKNSRELSHDNKIHLFIKIKGRVIFDQAFMRSNAVCTNNVNVSNLITELSSLGVN